MVARPFDVVVWGATGFTGRLVCEHIVRDYKGKVRWAMAGRDEAKLKSIRDELVKIDPDSKNVPFLLADANDSASLKKLASQTDVIIAVAGPYAKFGTNVVEAAVDQGTNYCDITGEILWVKRMQEAYHKAAAAKGVKVVHCCGYDSIPFDLGALFVVDHIQKALGKKVSQVYGLMEDARGGFSGGTIASGFNQAEAEDPKEFAALAGNKYYLWPKEGDKPGSDKPNPLLPWWSSVANKWLAPFIMEPVNSRIVQYSNYLAPGHYGSDFRYTEATATSSIIVAGITTAMMASFGAMLSFSLLRGVAKRALPAPGEGPSRELMMSGYWKHRMIGITQEEGGVAGQKVVAAVQDLHRDPGYWGTSRMLLEAGLCLAKDRPKCDAAGCAKGGVLTPAAAMGMVLVERLRAADINFEVVESPALQKTPAA